MAGSVSFDRAAEFYDATRGYGGNTAEQVRDAIVQYTGATRTTRFLEMGVGTGRIAVPFIQAGYNYQGIDISAAMMAKLTAKLEADPNAASYNFDLHEGDVTDMRQFADGSFDVVLSVHVLHLVDGWQKAVQEGVRVLAKPGGYFLVGYDEVWRDHETATDEPIQPADRVRRKWRQILQELGYEKEAERPGVWNAQVVLEYLQTLNPQAELVKLLEYNRPEITGREMLRRIANRMYSESWRMSERAMTESVALLEKWVNEEMPDADLEVSRPATFQLVAARF